MRYYFLASGSSGNATALVNDENEILLIDSSINELSAMAPGFYAKRDCYLEDWQISKIL